MESKRKARSGLLLGSHSWGGDGATGWPWLADFFWVLCQPAFTMTRYVERSFLRKLAIALGILLAALAALTFFVFRMESFGGWFEGERLTRMQRSPQYKGTRFENTPPQDPDMHLWESLKKYSEGQLREPRFTIAVVQRSSEDFKPQAEPGLRAYWFGHASTLIEIDGLRIMTDPVFSEFASPFQVSPSPRRFHPVPLDLEKMPFIDAVVISHDHFDHLDMATTKAFAARGTHFYVGLGVGAHLERWGVPAGQIHEMDWWEQATLKGVRIVCTPARHYSGRRSMDNSTLWASWYVQGEKHSAYYSGDTGYASHFSEIAKRLGPVELAVIKVGAYGTTWLDIHMDPESAVQASLDLGARMLFPVHWATFNLSYHSWEEPILRAVAAAKAKKVNLVTPRVGERVVYGQPFASQRWYVQD